MPATEKLVTLNRLGTLLDAYGAAPERWPEQERAAALALIDTSADARAMVDEAQALDAALDRVERPAVSPTLSRRVHRLQLPRHRFGIAGLISGMLERLQPRPRFAWQGAVAAAAVIGIATGFALSEFADEAGPETVVATDSAVPAEPSATEPSIVLVDATGSSAEALAVTTLSPDVALLSLTGTGGADGAAVVQPDDSELAVAAIPLY